MATKQLKDLTQTTTIADNDILHIQTSTGFDRHITKKDLFSGTTTPTNTTPADTAIDINVAPTLTASAFSGNDTHEHSIFQVSTDNTFAIVDYDSGILGNVTSHTVTTALTAKLVYYWRVKYIGITSSSGWSTATSFTTTVAFSSLFATTLYTGTGVNLNVITGLDSVAKPSLVWVKDRFSIAGAGFVDHILVDTVRGAGNLLNSNDTGAEVLNAQTVSAFSSSGITVGNNSGVNTSGDSYVAWQWIVQAGFMDIVSYVGDGVAGKVIPHNLGTTAGMLIIKQKDGISFWKVQHKDISPTLSLALNTTASVGMGDWNGAAMTTTNFTVANTTGNANALGSNYIAYIFAHNPAKGIFCGSYTGTGAVGNKIVTGFPVGWLLVKDYNNIDDWFLHDNTRAPTNPRGNTLYPNLGNAEQVIPTKVNFFVDGFDFIGGTMNTIGGNYIFMAIADPAQF